MTGHQSTAPAALAARFGTPLYLYDLEVLDAAHASLRRELPTPHALNYSMKANPHPDVVRRLHDNGCGIDITSAGELETALACGVSPRACLYGGPGKKSDDIAQALARGVRDFSVESLNDLRRVGWEATAAGATADCLLRINPGRQVHGMAMTMSGLPSQFGTDAALVLAEARAYLQVAGARLTGLHFYLGSGLDSVAVLLDQFEVALATTVQMATKLGPLRRINLGGGFGHPFARMGSRPSLVGLQQPLRRLLDRHLPGWRHGEPLIMFESGRFLSAAAGTLLCTVVDVKRSGDRAYVVLDAGINQLGGIARSHRSPPVAVHAGLLEPRSGVAAPFDIVGPLCSPLDVWHHKTLLVDPEPGDLIAVANVGAYGLTAGLLAFLGHPAAVEVCTDGPTLTSATRLQLNRTTLTQ